MKKSILLLLLLVSAQVFALPDGTPNDTTTVVNGTNNTEGNSQNQELKGLGTKAFKELPDGEEAQLTLQSDTVLFVNGDEAFLRSGDGGAIMFYQSGLPLEAGQILYGTVFGRKETRDGMPVFVGSDKTNNSDYIVTYTMSAEYLEMSLRQLKNEQIADAGVMDSNVADFVVVDSAEVTAVNAAARSFTVSSSKMCGHSLTVVDRYNCCQSPVVVGNTYYNIKGIVIPNGKTDYQLYLAANLGQGTPTGIDSVVKTCSIHTVVYDLQGRRILGEPVKKGVYLRGGRKYVRK